MRNRFSFLLIILLLFMFLETLNGKDFRISHIDVGFGGKLLEYLIKKKVKQKTDNKVSIILQDSVALLFYKDRTKPVTFICMPDKQNFYYKRKGEFLATLIVENSDKVYLNFSEEKKNRKVNMILLPI